MLKMKFSHKGTSLYVENACMHDIQIPSMHIQSSSFMFHLGKNAEDLSQFITRQKPSKTHSAYGPQRSTGFKVMLKAFQAVPLENFVHIASHIFSACFVQEYIGPCVN